MLHAGPDPVSRFVPLENGSYVTWVPNADMAATLGPDAMRLRGPVSAPTWETSLAFLGIGRDGRITRPWRPGKATCIDSGLTWAGDGVDVQYVLSDDGLRQNFLVRSRETGSGQLQLNLALHSPHQATIEPTGDLVFHDEKGRFVHAYRGLMVWDHAGVPLPARMELDHDGKLLRILVDDRKAVYPITVDPISDTFDRLLNAPNAGTFGRCVSSAGDLNGDGYSDVAVGAFETTNGGEVYVYYGSATGIPAVPNITLSCGLANSNFGLGVDGAGDVNGDGYEDLIVGASSWNNNAATLNEGAVFVYHGSATGITNVPSIILQTNVARTFMGSSVAGLGDINGDGYSDIVAGGWLADLPSTSEGGAWVFLGSATGLNTIRHQLERNYGSAQFGYTVAGAGDINGDGYNDVIIGAHKFVHTGSTAAPDGRVFVYHGSANALGGGMNPNPTLAFNTNGISARTGWAVSSAGDVNGDGYSDVVIGDWQDEIGPELDEGVVLVYHGSAAGLNTTPVTIIEGGAAARWLGRSVSTAGDVNGDGYADILIGCSQWTNPQSKEGAVFLHLGSPTGINSSAFIRYESNLVNGLMGEWVSTAGDVNGDGYSDMVFGIPVTGNGSVRVVHGGTYNISTTPAVVRTSGIANARLGAAVANAGDVNGDGFSDALFAAPNGANGQAGEGIVYLHYGSLTGLSATPTLTLEANIANAAFGSSVASAGDVNGDGYADIIIGAPNSDGIGRAYIYHGAAGGLNPTPALVLSGTSGSLFGFSVFKAGDHNADGYSDILIGAPGADRVYVHPGSPTGVNPLPVVLSAPVAGGQFGSSVCTAGDVNGDGFSDFVIGAPNLSNPQANEGAIYVYAGALLTLPTAPQFSYESNTAGRRLGTSVAGGGDINGDSYYDVLAGAPETSSPEASEGATYIFYGSTGGTSAAGLGILTSNNVNARMGYSVAEAGDVNGDGYADIITGGPGHSNGQANEGRAWVYLGGPTGILAANFTSIEPNVVDEAFGSAVAGGGDVDGDGYSDVLVGSPNSSVGAVSEGTIRLYRGNNGLAYNRITRQYMADLVSPLATNSMDFDDHYVFGIGHRARSPIQRTTARLRWEVVHEGQPFSGAPITNSVAATGMSPGYTNLGLAGIEIKALVNKIPSRYRNRWRVRVEYPMHKSIDGQRFSRWFYGYASGVGDIGVLPVVLIDFQGSAISEGNLLQWSTGSEQGSDHFLIERSTNGHDFTPLGSVDAAGESLTLRNYRFLDPNAPKGISYYRMRMVDSDASEELSNTIALSRDNKSITVYPVPVNDVLFWSPQETPVVRVVIHDALGRTVASAVTQGDMLNGAPLEQLATGSYSILLLDEHGAYIARSRFLKR